MTRSPKMIVAAMAGLVWFFQAVNLEAQHASRVMRAATLAAGSIGGVVLDEHGDPVVGATVSALGPRTSVVVTDQGGRYDFPTLSPGPYLLRAHVHGFVGSRGQVVEVRAGVRTNSSIALRHMGTLPTPDVSATEPPIPILAAGVGIAIQPAETSKDEPPVADRANESPDPSVEDDHSETAWLLRHMRRSILKDVTMAGALLGEDETPGGGRSISALEVRAAGPGYADSLFAGMPLTGQFNLLTTGSFDAPKQLFTTDNFSRSIASVSLAAPVGDHADWSMRGALTQGDISSWFVSGAYATRVPARHRYDLGLSYSTQRYDGGNPVALREVSDGSRNVGAVYGFDTYTLTPALSISYGARFSRYDYLDGPGLLSPRFEIALSPADRFRLSALVSSRAVAPGAEEFLPPITQGLWLPPQRTFSSLIDGGQLRAQRTDHIAVGAERDFGTATISVRGFRQRIDDQLVTVFGFEASHVTSQLGHYLVGNVGDADTLGWTAGFRTTLASRVNGSVEYTMTQARWSPEVAERYLLLFAPATTLERVHDVATAVETNLPETATRILVVARVSNAAQTRDGSTYDSRFDVQVHQSLPFMDFSTARWEMLVAVRNSFHEAAIDASVFDELLVVRPPKRIVGGLTLRF
jgi:carboxypeptidase family protein/TonB-dependent receptor-like protein